MLDHNSYHLGLAGAIATLATRMPPVVGGETGVAYARAVASQAAKAASKVGEATHRAMKDTTKTENARKVAGARAAINTTKDARAALSKARISIAQDASIVRTKLAALERTSPDEAAIVAEIRNHFHGLKTVAKKLDLIQQAKADGDSLTLKAILAGPAYLSGMGSDLTQRLRTDFHQTEAPEDVAHLERLEESFEVIDEIDGAMAGLVNEFNSPEVQSLIQMAKAATE